MINMTVRERGLEGLSTVKYCCEDFKDLLDDGYIDEDKGELRSNGCFVREKYVLHSYDGLGADGGTIDMYIRYCPRCGKSL